MKESISIKNLGPLSDVYIPDIKPLTVLIGESGSGKSLLMKTLILFRYIYKMLNIRWYLKNSNVSKTRFRLAIGKLLSPELKEYFKNKELEVVYAVEINGNTHSVVYRNGGIERSFSNSRIPNEDLVFLKESWISELRNIIPEWLTFGSSSPRPLDFYFKETFNDFQLATESPCNISLNYLGLSLDIEKRSEKKKLMIRPFDGSYKPIELIYGSSGAQTSSSIITLVDYFSSSFSFKEAINRSVIRYLYDNDTLKLFKPDLEPMDMKKFVHIHIEEPELNLFPDAQCRLLEDLAKDAFVSVSDDRELRLIMSTHSPYLVNYLNILLNQTNENKVKVSHDNMAVFRIYNGALQSLMAVDGEGRRFVDTSDLTAQMEAIMEEYDSITR